MPNLLSEPPAPNKWTETERWVAAIVGISAALKSFGVIPPEAADQINAGAQQAIQTQTTPWGFIGLIVIGAVYILGRSGVKMFRGQ